ncbi:MAG TPA: hypothetical protein VNO52_02155 [Methylomirabilota bacterium]|nr:hypothetical protein [Methylomirabilota bacterium]
MSGISERRLGRAVRVAGVVFWAGGLLLCARGAEFQKFASQFPLGAPEVPAAAMAQPAPRPWSGIEPAPVPGMVELARERSGAIWLGSTNGAARFDPRAKHRWDRWQYFHGWRWLMDDDVQHAYIEESRTGRKVWLRTRTAVSLIEWRPMTLEQKAACFDARIEARHVRHGMVADSRFEVAGDPASNVTTDNDNDGLWTAIYLGAQCYRYAVTRDSDARRKAERAMRALVRLEEITGHPGFPARSIVSTNEPRPGDGEWHPTPDGRWLWKGDTSSDELVGHYYGHALYFDLVANEQEKALIRGVVARITDHLIRNDYDLIDLDGRPTRWGQWSERYFQTEEGRYEAALRSLELLAFLKTAHHITGNAKYDQAYRDRIQRGYAEHMRHYRRWPGGGEINFSDDELAYLSYDPLLRYEKDPKLRALYLDGLRFTWSQVWRDMNPLWNYISVASGAGRLTPDVREQSRRTLERIPMDMVKWTVRNSHRADVRFEPAPDRFNRPQLTEVLAPDERPVQKWNSNPYRPDGGSDGRGEDDGAYFLLPYWMGRYLRAL